jgi:hypothetical protein
MFLNGILAVIVLGLALQVARTWMRTLPPIEARAAAKGAVDVPTRSAEGGKRGKRAQADKTPQTPAMLVTTIVNKDLFDPSRTKPSEDTKVAAAPAHVTNPPQGITLVGVRAFGKDREGFILDATQANTQRRVRSGDTIGDFTVKSIRQESIVLVSQAGDYVTLSLAVDTAAAKAPGGAAPAVAPRPGRPQPAGAAAAALSPSAGVVQGTPTAAGVGAPVKAPAVTAVSPGAQPGLPKPPAPAPNLPEGVRQKLQQMKNGLNKR